MTSKPSSMLRSYLEFVLAEPVRVWWGIGTAVVDLVAYAAVGNSLTLGRWAIVVLISVVSFGLMVGGVLSWKCWPLYVRAQSLMRISQVRNTEEGLVWVLEGGGGVAIGSLVQVYRRSEGIEVPIALLRVDHERDDGEKQASEVWIGAGHKRDIQVDAVSVESLLATSAVSHDIVNKWVQVVVEGQVKALIDQGGMGR